MPLRFTLPYRGFKLQARNQLQNLTENTAYSIQGETSVGWYRLFAGTRSNLTAVSPLPLHTTRRTCLQTNLDNSDFEATVAEQSAASIVEVLLTFIKDLSILVRFDNADHYVK